MHMNTWYTLNLGDALLADRELERIGTLFASEAAQHTQNGDMAIFIRHESEGRLHCAVTLYFSPAAAALARTLGATPCPRPAMTDLGLFAGTGPAFARWFGVNGIR